MPAGDSARQEARRARERAEQLERRVEMFQKGADGEARTAHALEALGSDWMVLHDFRWPGRRLANIDHVVVGPGGIFVIDSKNWSGDVRVTEQVLRQNGRAREKAVASAADAALAVSELAGPHSEVVRPVLCFTREEPVSGWARDVMVCSTSNLVQMLQSRPRTLGSGQVSDAAMRLAVSLRDAVSPPIGGREAAPKASGTSTQSRPAHNRSQSRRRRGSKRGESSPRRLLAGLVGGVLLMVAIPTVLPGATSVISDILVEQFMPDDVCTKRGAAASEDDATRAAKGPQADRQARRDRCP